MNITAQNLFDITIGIMSDQKSNSGGYKEYYLPGILNTVLSECFELENMLRERDGQEILTEAPYVTKYDDIIPYHAELVRNVLPWGIGMLFLLGDDENVKATFFSSKYDENKAKFTPALYVDTEAVF